MDPRGFLPPVVAAALAAAAGPGYGADLIVEVSGIRDAEGSIEIGVFDSPAGFPFKGSEPIGVSVRADLPVVAHRFRGLEPGRYAVAVFHDRDGDGRLDKTLVGRPKEPYGFSNGARASAFAPPAFESAAFELLGEKVVRIELQRR